MPVTMVQAREDTRVASRPPQARTRPGVALLFLSLLAYQAFHHLEHTIETVQLQVLGHETAHTLIGGLDFEWVHLAANGFLFWGLMGVAIGAGKAVRARWRTSGGWGWWGLVGALTVQGYHVGEHLVRIVQYLVTGEEPVGTVTTVLNPVWFHFGVNLAVLVCMAVGFFGLRMHHTLGLGLRGGAPPTAAR